MSTSSNATAHVLMAEGSIWGVFYCEPTVEEIESAAKEAEYDASEFYVECFPLFERLTKDNIGISY